MASGPTSLPHMTAAFVAVLALAGTACSPSIDVTAERADPIRTPTVEAPTTSPGAGTNEADDPDDAANAADPASPDEESGGATAADDPTGQVPPPSAGDLESSAVDFGPNKPTRDYDDFLRAVAADLDLWWSQQYPAIYGEPFEPLQGAIYAAYPERPDDLPGCGAPRTTYDDVQQFVAFYCGVGDFIVYDDGEDGLLAELVRDYGRATIGTVIAHEYSHAIQFRFGGLDRDLPTVVTEQQADCFAGAWTARVSQGESVTVSFSDRDVRAGVIAMTKVSDPVGIDQLLAGGHGSAFDRVGAFQEGYNAGPARCAQLLDDPLPLMPNEFLDLDDATNGGDATFGYGDTELVGFLPDDLNRYWDEELAAQIPGFDQLTITVVDSGDDADCTDLRDAAGLGVALCASTGQVIFDEAAVLELYLTLGDFAVGYALGTAWSEAVQVALGSELEGEARALVNDCLTGGWVKTITPVDFALPEPRLPERDSVRTSPGDLDEAIQTILTIADLGADDDVIGDAVEKIDAFRAGVLDGTQRCLADL